MTVVYHKLSSRVSDGSWSARYSVLFKQVNISSYISYVVIGLDFFSVSVHHNHQKQFYISWQSL